jgi:hypothetical protein
MALPGFTAEASVGPATQVYRTTYGYGIEAADVHPQSSDGESSDGFDEAGPEDAEAMESGGDDDLEPDDDSDVW